MNLDSSKPLYRQVETDIKTAIQKRQKNILQKQESFRYECLHTESWCFIMELKININNTQDQTAVLEIMADI